MAKNEEVKITLSAEFESKGVKQGASQVQEALKQTQKSFENTELASKKLQKSLEKTEGSTKGLGKSVGSIKTPKGIKGLTKSVGKGRGGLGFALGAASLAAGGAVIAIGAVASKVVTMGRESKEAYENMRKYEGGLKAIQQATSGTASEMGQLDTIIRDLGARTGEDIQDVADYVSQFTALGVGQKEATEAVTAALNVAKVEGKDTSRVVSALMESYKGSSEQAKKLGLNVQGLTKEQLASGEAVDRIQEAYGETLTQAAQLTVNEQETNRLLQETQEIKSKMWTQAEGMKEAWDLIKLAIARSKKAAAKAFQPMVKHINRAVKRALNLRKTLKLSGAILEQVFLTVLGRISKGYADMYDFLTGWSTKALSLIGVSIDVISEKLRGVSDDLYERADAAAARAQAIREEIYGDVSGAEKPSDAGGSGDTGGLSDRDTRVSKPEKTPRAKKEKSEKDDFWKRQDAEQNELIKQSIIEREKLEAERALEEKYLAELQVGLAEERASRDEMLQERWAKATEILTANLKTQKTIYREELEQVRDLSKSAEEIAEESIESIDKFKTIWEHIKQEWKTQITDPFNQRLKTFAEGTTHYDNAGHALKNMLSGGIKNALKGGVKKLASAGIGAMKSIGSMAAQAPAMMAAKAAIAFQNLVKNTLSMAIERSGDIVAPSELAAIDQSTKEGRLEYLEATESNSQIGQDAAKELTSNFLSEFSPALGSLFEAIFTDPEKLDAFFENLTVGFTIMIEKLSENIGPIINTLAKNMPRVVTALVKALPKIMKAIHQHLPKAIEILVYEIVIALPQIIGALIEGIWEGMKTLINELPAAIWSIFKGLGRGIGSLFGFGSSPSPPSSYATAGIAPPPQNLAAFRGVQNEAEQIRKELDDDDDEDSTEKDTVPRIAPITIGGVERTDQTLTAAEAFNPYINEDFSKEAKQPVKIEIQIGDQRLREVLTDLSETGLSTVVTA